MKIQFTKMHGLGNDFVLIDAQKMPNQNWKEIAKKVLNRRTSVGADQLLVLLPSKTEDVELAIFEQDGGRSEMCGNGIRCVAQWLNEQNPSKRKFTVGTLAGKMVLDFESSQSVTVDMGKPIWIEENWGKTVEVAGEKVQIFTVSMGNPHAVIFVNSEKELTLKRNQIGPILETHALFKNRTNVEFVFLKNKHELITRVWERGAGATLACGTGACASAVVALKLQKAENPVQIQYELGTLHISWKDGGTISMTGPATKVFEGEIEI